MNGIRKSLPLLLLVLNCFGSIKANSETAQTEQLNRQSTDYMYLLPPPHYSVRELYPWEKKFAGKYAPITKEYFRCKGCSTNPIKLVEKNGTSEAITDCSSNGHSLPVRDGKEEIYPILIDLLNFIQARTNRRVVITCGHRCPAHNTYADPSTFNANSKHMIGAEVDFYVEGLENQPLEIISYIQDYYRGQKEFETFQRYEGPDTNVSTPPWFNKEVFVKLYKPDEGRDLDNQHPYSYLSIQVRYDRARGKRVTYTWEEAFRGYLRDR